MTGLPRCAPCGGSAAGGSTLVRTVSVLEVTATAPELPTPADAGETTGSNGLTAAEVANGSRRGHVNVADERTSRTLREIAAREHLSRGSTRSSASMLVVI